MSVANMCLRCYQRDRTEWLLIGLPGTDAWANQLLQYTGWRVTFRKSQDGWMLFLYEPNQVDEYMIFCPRSVGWQGLQQLLLTSYYSVRRTIIVITDYFRVCG